MRVYVEHLQLALAREQQYRWVDSRIYQHLVSVAYVRPGHYFPGRILFMLHLMIIISCDFPITIIVSASAGVKTIILDGSYLDVSSNRLVGGLAAIAALELLWYDY